MVQNDKVVYCHRLFRCCLCGKGNMDGILLYHKHEMPPMLEQVTICRECVKKIVEVMNDANLYV